MIAGILHTPGSVQKTSSLKENEWKIFTEITVWWWDQKLQVCYRANMSKAEAGALSGSVSSSSNQLPLWQEIKEYKNGKPKENRGSSSSVSACITKHLSCTSQQPVWPHFLVSLEATPAGCRQECTAVHYNIYGHCSRSSLCIMCLSKLKCLAADHIPSWCYLIFFFPFRYPWHTYTQMQVRWFGKFLTLQLCLGCGPGPSRLSSNNIERGELQMFCDSICICSPTSSEDTPRRSETRSPLKQRVSSRSRAARAYVTRAVEFDTSRFLWLCHKTKPVKENGFSVWQVFAVGWGWNRCRRWLKVQLELILVQTM